MLFVVSLTCIKGLPTTYVEGKEFSKSSDNPLFIAPLIDTIFFTPSIFKCSPALIKLTILLNSKKSAYFWVCKLNLVKARSERYN